MSDDKESSQGATASPFDPSQFLQFMQQAWSKALPQAIGVPPGMTVADLDKRITELRVVEQWLDVNLAMLRTSLQALEVQRGTLATLQSFGEQLGEKKASPGMDPAAEAAPGLAAFSKVFQQMNDVSQNSLMPWWQNLQSQFETIASKAVPPTASSSTAAAWTSLSTRPTISPMRSP